MKVCSLFFSLLLSASLCALPVGNPAEPAFFTDSAFCSSFGPSLSLRGGFYGDYVFNRHLQVDSSETSAHIDRTRLYTNAGYIALNYCSFLDLFATLGASHMWLRTPSTAFRLRGLAEGEFFTIDTNTSFSWSVGSRIALWECRCFTLGVEGQYFQSAMSIDYVREEDDNPIYISGHDACYREGQCGLALSRAFVACDPKIAFVPYLGVKAAWSDVTMDNLRVVVDNIQTDTYFLRDLESTKVWGVAVGMSVALRGTIALSAERRFGDEQGVYINGQIRF